MQSCSHNKLPFTRLRGNKTYECSISATAGSVIELWISAIKPRPGEKISLLLLADLEVGAPGEPQGKSVFAILARQE